MVDPVQIKQAPGSFLAAVDLYRMPDGSVRMELRDMAAHQIEAFPTISQRFIQLAAWLISGSGSALDQGLTFRKDEVDATG